jgi:hypothetical protein
MSPMLCHCHQQFQASVLQGCTPIDTNKLPTFRPVHLPIAVSAKLPSFQPSGLYVLPMLCHQHLRASVLQGCTPHQCFITNTSKLPSFRAVHVPNALSSTPPSFRTSGLYAHQHLQASVLQGCTPPQCFITNTTKLPSFRAVHLPNAFDPLLH